MSYEVSLGVLRHGRAPVEGEAPVDDHRVLHPQPIDWQTLDERESTALNYLVAETLQLRAQGGEGELLSTDILRFYRTRMIGQGSHTYSVDMSGNVLDMLLDKLLDTLFDKLLQM